MIHYVLSHHNIIGNELADKYAKKITEMRSIKNQNSKLITLSNFKSYLKRTLIEKWYISKTNENNKSL